MGMYCVKIFLCTHTHIRTHRMHASCADPHVHVAPPPRVGEWNVVVASVCNIGFAARESEEKGLVESGKKRGLVCM